MTAQVLRSLGRSYLQVLVALLVLALASTDAFAASATYAYDTKGRVSSITYDDSTLVEYAYDANGNRTSATKTNPPPDTTPPGPPGTPTFSNITMSSARVDWAEASDNRAVVGYDYRVNSGGWQPLNNVLTVTLTNLSAVTTYTVYVRARDLAENFGPASSGSFTTPDTAAPSTPTGLNGSAPTSTAVNLSWNPSTDNVAVTGYKIFRNGSQIATRTTTTYTDSGRTGSTTYTYRVSAYDQAGNNSSQSSAISVTTPDTIEPSTPTNLSASAASPTKINLTWSGSSDSGGSGLAGYKIYRGGVQIATTSSTSYGNTGLASNTTYSYRVAAYDNAGNTSAQSSADSATTWPVLSATVSATSWKWLRRPNGNTIIDPDIVATASGGSGTGYTYAWQRVSGDTTTTVVSPTSSSTKWSRIMPNANVSYSSVWRCRVTDSTGATAYSPNVTVTFTRQTNQ
jgi:YD repeat-containing protein